MQRAKIIGIATMGAVAVAGGIALAVDPSNDLKNAHIPLFGEKPLTKVDDAPPWVTHVAKQAVPGATISSVQIDFDDYEAVYEYKGTLSGKALEIDIRPDGSLEETELVIDRKDVPADVAKLFDSVFPKFALTKVERSTRPRPTGLHTVYYEFDGKTEKGQSVDVEIDSRATTYLVEPD